MVMIPHFNWEIIDIILVSAMGRYNGWYLVRELHSTLSCLRKTRLKKWSNFESKYI